ncbi:heterokaryon incompatibility protein-domain-containing protein [Cladorrhinum sp. PSN259]|nr:heterokaryon incompatibility protein-domain-containing protein [Cladorrhinum sp. PSN259]
MRLINVHTLQLHEFFGSQIPQFQYAILSHMWEDEEVTFQEMQSLKDNPAVRDKKGFSKIHLTCEQAKREGLEWAWVDTCCIDKSSSAELSEAINSMYTWYARSKICYAYLNDAEEMLDIDESRWFTRGWTLQELIAPSAVSFFVRHWEFIGTRNSLTSFLSFITGIPPSLLYPNGASIMSAGLGNFSVAQRMSWASKRQTTREEDMAYCLLGIFDIHMPLLYGEGSKAFMRLQEEIIKHIDDHTLFAWPVDAQSPAAWSIGSVLAKSPADFAACSSIEVLWEEVGDPSVLTKKGLHIHAPLIPLELPDTTRLHNYGSENAYSRRGIQPPQLFQLVLNCRLDGSPHSHIVLWLFQDDHIFGRVMAPGFQELKGSKDNFTNLDKDFRRIYIRTKPLEEEDQPFTGGGFHFHGVPLTFFHSLYDNFSEPLWEKGWSLVASNERHVGSEIRSSAEIHACTHRKYKQLKSQIFISSGSFTGPADSTTSITTGLWEKKMLPRATIYDMLLVGEPEWTTCPALVCGTVQKKRTGELSDAGLLFWFAASREAHDLEGQLPTCSFMENYHPPIIYPNGQTGELAILKAKCSKTIIEILIYREPTSHGQGTGLTSDEAQTRPHFLFIFSSYSTRKGTKEKPSLLDDYRTLGRLGNTKRDVNLGMAKYTRMKFDSDMVEEGMFPIDEMLEQRRKRHTDKVKRDGGKEPRGVDKHSLEWCRLYIFEQQETGKRLPQARWEQRFRRDGSCELPVQL